jgi:hypothetical protein
MYMKRKLDAQNAAVANPRIVPSLKGEDDTDDDTDGSNKQTRAARGKVTAPAPSLIDDNEASNAPSADGGKRLPAAVRATPAHSVTRSQGIEEDDDNDEAPELFMPPPEQAAAELELVRQHHALVNKMRKDFEERLKGHVEGIKRSQSVSSTRPGYHSTALSEQIDRLQVQHDTELAILSSMTKSTTQQEIARVTATLRSKRREKLTRLAELKAQKTAGAAEAGTVATSPVAPQSVIELLQEQTTIVSKSTRAEANIILEAQNDHEKAILGDSSTDGVAQSSSLPAVKLGKQVPKDIETFLFLRRSNSSYGAASQLARATRSSIVPLAPPASLGRSERDSDEAVSDEDMAASDDKNPAVQRPIFIRVSELMREDKERQELLATLARKIQSTPPDVEDLVGIVRFDAIFSRAASLLDNAW